MNEKKRPNYPVIGISSSLGVIETGSFAGLFRVQVTNNYVKAVSKAKGMPIILPILDDEMMIEENVKNLDGLILTGGVDVNPLLYGEEPHKNLGTVCFQRDFYEFQLIKACFKYRKPILGICRGMQVLNVVCGGTLYQDIDAALSSSYQHIQKASVEALTHSVELVQGTKLQQLMNKNVILTNSFHHQSIKSLGDGIIVNAYAKDGVIEGIEKSDDLFTLGVQWHPEFLIKDEPLMQQIFIALVDAANHNRDLT